MRKIIAAIVLAATLCTFATPAYACTTILVGKNASADGSAFAGRTADNTKMAAAKLAIFPACEETGTYEFTDPESGFTMKLPKANYRCIIEPIYSEFPDLWWESGFNDAGVGISSTESLETNEAVQAVDPFVEGGMSEENIPRLVLPYITSAKEGVQRIGSFVEQYGMLSPEGVALIDENEIWYMEILSGHQWAAHRLPDDEYACIANDCLLDFYDPGDTDNWLGSDGVVELAKKAGTYTELDGKFHLALSYTPGKRNYSQLRIWDSRRYFNNVSPDSYDVNTQYPFSTKPEKKIVLQDILALTRDRHENTPYATDVVGNTRPIGIDRTAQAHLFQYKKGCVPIMWSCVTAPEFGIYLPVRNNIKTLPQKLTVCTPRYSEKSFSWQLRLISDMAVTDRAQYSQLVRSPFLKLENKFIESTQTLPNPTADEATRELESVSREAWTAVNSVKTDLITEVSNNTAIAAEDLGRN